MKFALRLRKPAGFLRAENGAAALEFAIWALIMIPVTLNVVDIGVYLYKGMEVDNVAQSAAQAAWTHCSTPPTSTCSNFATYVTSAMSSSSALASSVTTDQATQWEEGYYCPTSTGALNKLSSGTVCGTSPSTYAAGYYFKITVSYSYTPLFGHASVVSILGDPIQINQTAWTRLV